MSNNNNNKSNNEQKSSVIQDILNKKNAEHSDNKIAVQDLSQKNTAHVTTAKEAGINPTGNQIIDAAKIYLAKIPYTNEANLHMNSHYNFETYDKYKGWKKLSCSLENAIRTLLNSNYAIFKCQDDTYAKSMIAIIKATKSITNLPNITNIRRRKAVELIAKSHNLSW